MSERASLTAAGIALGASLAAVKSPSLQQWDRRAGLALSRPLGRHGDTLVGAGTDLGSVYAILGISTALAVRRRTAAAVDVFGAGSAAWVAAQAIKPLVDRPRPYQADGVMRIVAKPSGASWPSGHVAVAAAMAGSMAPALPPAGRLVATGLTAFVAASRIYVGVHYLTDVIAGVGLGMLCAKAWRGLRGRFGAHTG